MIVFHIFSSFFKNCVKVLEMYWLLTLFKNKNKNPWVVLWRLTLFRNGTKLSSLLSIPLKDFDSGTRNIVISIPGYFKPALQSISMKSIGAKWLNILKWNFIAALHLLKSLKSFQMMISLSSLRPEIKKKKEICADQSICVLTSNLDMSCFLAHFIVL